MIIHCINNDEIFEMWGWKAPFNEVALNCESMRSTKSLYLRNQTTYVWTDLVGFEETYWKGVFGFQELTREDARKWCLKLNAMLRNESILIWQLGDNIDYYGFNYREVLEELMDDLNKILESDKYNNHRFIIEFINEKDERKASLDW